MRRLFVEEAARELLITGDDAVHLLYAMRARVGQVVAVSDAKGRSASAKIVQCLPEAVRLLVTTPWSESQEAPIAITLVQALPKASKMDFIVQKVAELGVRQIVPVQTENCVVRYDAQKCSKKQEKWQKIADEAAKQCGRSQRVAVLPIVSLEEFLRQERQGDCFICYEREKKCFLRDFLATSEAKSYTFLVGPEGGFSEKEAEQCKKAGFSAVSLGSRILRLETVPLAVAAILQYEKGDIGKDVEF